MELEAGSVIVGKVSGIAKFGAFVSLPSGKSGLVHISEIANTYVGDVHDFLQEGQEVKVKVLNIDANGRINLSVKQAQEPSQRAPYPKGGERPSPRPKTGGRPGGCNAGAGFSQAPKPQQPQESSFEDKLKRFMQDSDSKMSDVKIYSERRGSRRRGRG